MMAENLAEGEGLKAIPREGHKPHDHNELMFRFCRAAGLSDTEVRNMKMTPAWWARSLYYYNTAVVEPIGVVLAMQTTQEGQMPGLIGEVLLPASTNIRRRMGVQALAYVCKQRRASSSTANIRRLAPVAGSSPRTPS
jgi:hypothetical protein